MAPRLLVPIRGNDTILILQGPSQSQRFDVEPPALDDANGENPLRGIVAESLEAALGILGARFLTPCPLESVAFCPWVFQHRQNFIPAGLRRKIRIVEISLEFQVVWRLRCRPGL
jgi:hypothetical protein